MSHGIGVFSNVKKIVPAVKAHARKHAVKLKVKRCTKDLGKIRRMIFNTPKITARDII